MDERMGITLKKAMRILDDDDVWTVATEDGECWIFYFDGKELHDGSMHGMTLEKLMDREVVSIYERDERKYWSDEDRKYFHFVELEKGLAFIVKGNENGRI